MKKLLLTALALGLSPLFAGIASAQQVTYKTEVCVNASDAAEAKRLFPNATLHVIPDSSDPDMNGWRIVTGQVDAKGRIMTDSEEIQLREHERTVRSVSGRPD